MRKLRLILALVAVNLFVGVGVAHADPVTAAVATWVSGIATTVFGAGMSVAFAIHSATTFLLRSVGMSLLSQALSKKPKARAVGIKTQTTTGGAVSQTFVLGKFATAGQLVAPLNAYGTDGKTPNAYLTYVVARGCIPGQKLSRLILNDDYVAIDPSLTPIGGSEVLGHKLLGIFEGNAWIRYYDGTQTTADPLLRAKFGSDPQRPWSFSMVGRGRPYAVLVFRYNREVLNSPPTVRFEENGIPLFDPRDEDQSWDVPSSWMPTLNPVVMIYNLHRGIPLPDGSVYGGEAEAEDLPLDNWMAAMNVCDEPVALTGGGTEPRFTAGLEVSLSDEPADVIEALETACQAQQVEMGGVWKIRVGGPGLPVQFITGDDGALKSVFRDEDILIDRDRGQDMFPGLAGTYNGIQGSHPLPSALWEMTDAPARFNEDWETADDGRRLIADLALPAVFSPTQAQRLMKSTIEEERRFRRHTLSMGPYASMLEPLDAIAWRSVSEGYGKDADANEPETGKVFEITAMGEGLRTLTVDLALRERDSNDFIWEAGDALPWVAAQPGRPAPVVQAVPGFHVAASAILDAASRQRRPAIEITWSGTEMPDVRGLMYEVRVKAKPLLVTAGTVSDITSGAVLIVEGILPATVYEVRARLIVDRLTAWTDWVTVATDDIRVDFADLAESLVTAIETPLDELLKTNLQLQTYQQIQDALNYTGDGRSLQFATLEAINKGQDAIDRFNLLGVLSTDKTAYVLNTAFAKISETETLAGLIEAVATNTSKVTEQKTAIDTVGARYALTVENVGTTGDKAVAGMIADAGTTSTIGFFADRFFIAAPFVSGASTTYKYPFYYESLTNELRLTADVHIAGNLVVDGTITTQKLIDNAVSSFNDDDFGSFPGEEDLTVAYVPINPGGKRVRLDYSVAVDGDGDRYAILVKLYKDGNFMANYGYVGDASFRCQINGFHYDFDYDTEEVEYSMKVMTVRGTNIGDGHTPTADPVEGTIIGGILTAEVKKK
jgi:hypothetical protein